MDETREQKPGPMIDHGGGPVLHRDAGALTAECDLAVVLDHQCTLGDGHQRMGGFGHQRRAGEVKNVPKMNPRHAIVP